jgi:transcriptional regulator with XRE-family HTH domain
LTPIDGHIARRLRGKRLALALSEIDLANALGVGREVLEKYEKGLVRVPPEQLIRLSELLDVPISYFFPADLCPGH